LQKAQVARKKALERTQQQQNINSATPLPSQPSSVESSTALQDDLSYVASATSTTLSKSKSSKKRNQKRGPYLSSVHNDPSHIKKHLHEIYELAVMNDFTANVK